MLLALGHFKLPTSVVAFPDYLYTECSREFRDLKLLKGISVAMVYKTKHSRNVDRKYADLKLAQGQNFGTKS